MHRFGYGIAVALAAGFGVLTLWVTQLPVSAEPAPFTARIPARVTRIVFYGDSRPHNPAEVWRDDPGMAARLAVVVAIAGERPDLVVHSGDLVGQGDSPGHWARFDTEHAPLRDARIPFYPVMGNHEYMGVDNAARRHYFARFPELRGRLWYSLTAGPLRILMVDTNIASIEQQAWYVRELRAASADAGIRCVVVVGHHSPYTNAFTHPPDEAVQSTFVEPARAHPKVKLFVTGHVHAYERFEIDGRTFLVSGGGGAPLMHVRTGDAALFADRYRGGQIRPHHYCVATLREDGMTVDVMMLDDKTMTWRRGDGFTVGF